MHELSDKDRHAILLRFFQNKPLQEVGVGLNVTENAARMRVERALDKLRGKLVRRGIATSASALAAVVSANAVQPAPAGFAATVSTAVMASSALHVSTLIATTKTIAMTTVQKAIVAAALAIAAGTGIYAVHQGSQLRSEIHALQQERAPLTAQLQQLQQERDQAAQQLAASMEESARLKSGQNTSELLRLRGQVGVLRQQAGPKAAPTSGLAKLMSDPAMKEYIRHAQTEKLRSIYADLFKELNLTPDQVDTFLQLMMDTASKRLAKYTTPGQQTTEQASGESSNDLGSQLQALLGDAGLARFKEFSDEIPARTTISLLNSQLGDNALNNEQNAHLLEIVKAEPAQLTMGITGAPDSAFLGSQADIDSFLEQVAESNQRILQQANTILTPGQLAALNTVLTNAINTRKIQAAALIQQH